MILRELYKASQITTKQLTKKTITAEERAEWRQKYDALSMVVECIKHSEWIDDEERKKAFFILTKGYKAAMERYGVSRQALSKSFAQVDKDIEGYVSSLSVQLIMNGLISASYSYMKAEKMVNEVGFMVFPKGVLELLPEPVECTDEEFNELELTESKNPELQFLQALTVDSICKRLIKCDMAKLAKLLGAFSATADGEHDRQLEFVELLMGNDN